ncbi:flagellar hook-basal body complex protein FliE, putative [Oceaniovalibus guishaninsula JLT2003]|uniref:Flagellar hook-basal body complex protein FliE, putative n=1 Tax=Oceaniovalibus guishaninsula JLT2003 TaxID=1231392 RepID=K2H823_9RHOB|nr:flagellar hook-basal body complex protein FliE [Oceaniovalibus guishaninsula]EKE43778.1 flagellar hook-basal body complex protein FliE, putative [Oceaniovalibus guishaninsula JLT2003]
MDIAASLAAQKYTATRPATAADPLAQTAGAAAQDFLTTLQKGEETARAAMTGGADAHSLVEALAQARSAVETVVTVRDKVVEAYQEILRMPV